MINELSCEIEVKKNCSSCGEFATLNINIYLNTSINFKQKKEPEQLTLIPTLSALGSAP
jgi:hypothetical protein